MPPTLTVTPKSALFDQPVAIRAAGLRPGQPVRLTAAVQFPWTPGRVWKSAADYPAGPAGELRLENQAADPGDPESDPMRLFWSLRPEPDPAASPAGQVPAELDTRQALAMTFTLSSAGQVLATETVERCFQSPEIQSSPYQAEGLRGRFFFHAPGQAYPGIVFFSGSGSLAPILPISALLASYGYNVLALAYFGAAEGLPPRPSQIPIERFEEAIGWLLSQPGVIKERIGVMGGSLGGELALLAGALDARIKAVAAISPSPIVFSPLEAGQGQKDASSPWCYQGQALPYASASLTRLAWEVLTQAVRGRAFQYSPAYRKVLQNPRATQQAMIPIESIHGPILLVSGTDDGYWPATDLCEIALGRLKDNRFTHPVYHLGYAGAGHSFYAPYLLPTGPVETPVLPGLRFSSGGTPVLNSRAQADSWSKILRFFQQHL